jgi:putative oxidoreductase
MRWYTYVGGPGALGLLVLRLVAGVAFILHGWPKVYRNQQFVLMEWMGPQAPVPGFLQAAAAIAEFGGGIAWILGFLTPLFSLLLAVTMAVAACMFHIKNGDPFIAMNMPGQPFQAYWEPAAVYFAVAMALLLVGPGTLSLDYCLFGRRRSDEPLRTGIP